MKSGIESLLSKSNNISIFCDFGIGNMRSLDFQDVFLVPRVISNIESRDHIKINVKLSNFNLTCPIIASPMKDVCDGDLAAEIYRLGGLGIIHRFMSIEDQVKEYKKCINCSCAVGINDDYYERFTRLYDMGCKVFCLDVANGGSYRVRDVAEKLSKHDVDLIVGNVASKECFEWLQEIPAVVGIRAGIAGGASCSTRNATGIYNGMVSVIQECASVKKNCLLIADGGIKEPQDACKAIAFGADLVMMGSLIASTSNSPAEIVLKDNKQYKVYHGSASFDIQKFYKEKPRYIEGKTKVLEYTGESLEQLCSRFSDGLKSSMSYFNATDFDQYRKNMSFCYK